MTVRSGSDMPDQQNKRMSVFALIFIDWKFRSMSPKCCSRNRIQTSWAFASRKICKRTCFSNSRHWRNTTESNLSPLRRHWSKSQKV